MADCQQLFKEGQDIFVPFTQIAEQTGEVPVVVKSLNALAKPVKMSDGHRIHLFGGQHLIRWFLTVDQARRLTDKRGGQNLQKTHLDIMGAHGKDIPQGLTKAGFGLLRQAEDQVGMEMDIVEGGQSAHVGANLGQIHDPVDGGQGGWGS